MMVNKGKRIDLLKLLYTSYFKCKKVSTQIFITIDILRIIYLNLCNITIVSILEKFLLMN